MKWDLMLPLHEQYIDFVEGAVKLDFGTSYFTKEVVIDAIVRCFKVTVKLACDVFCVCSAAIGIHVRNFCSSLKEARALILSLMTFSLVIGVSAPAFWVAIILADYFWFKTEYSADLWI